MPFALRQRCGQPDDEGTMSARQPFVHRILWILLIGGILALVGAIIVFARGSFLFTDYFFASLAA
jgi:hypothetical protein